MKPDNDKWWDFGHRIFFPFGKEKLGSTKWTILMVIIQLVFGAILGQIIFYPFGYRGEAENLWFTALPTAILFVIAAQIFDNYYKNHHAGKR